MVNGWKNLFLVEKGKEKNPDFQINEKSPNPVGTKEEIDRLFNKKPFNPSGKLKKKTE